MKATQTEINQNTQGTNSEGKETGTQINDLAKDLNRHFSKEDMQRVQRLMKRCSALLAIRERCKLKPQ